MNEVIVRFHGVGEHETESLRAACVRLFGTRAYVEVKPAAEPRRPDQLREDKKAAFLNRVLVVMKQLDQPYLTVRDGELICTLLEGLVKELL
jgi:hypothetical protein